jgi:hypothetical protein
MNSKLLPFKIARVAAVLLVSALINLAAAGGETSQYYELRTYATQSAEQQQRVNDYLHNAAIPAYNRLGVQPVGVFTELNDSATNNVYVLLPFNSVSDFADMPSRLAADTNYQQAATEFLNAPQKNAAYTRIESSLLVAFDGMKRMVVPAAGHRPNVFELRTYESSSEGRGLNKIQMFESGEIPLMKEVGLAPIFYGRTIAGLNMPCLIYLTCGESPDAHKQHWKEFFNSPIWQKLSRDPKYQDNVSRVISVMLKRTVASQI